MSELTAFDVSNNKSISETRRGFDAMTGGPKGRFTLRNRKMHFSKLLVLMCWLIAGPVAAAPRVKVLKLAITNPSDETRLAEDIVISVAELKRIAPDFKAGDAMVTTSDASTLEEDARTLQTIELPSQADDLDGDNKSDELAFQIDLKPKQTLIVTIPYGNMATIQRLPSNYSKRCEANCIRKFYGLAWESDATACR